MYYNILYLYYNGEERGRDVFVVSCVLCTTFRKLERVLVFLEVFKSGHYHTIFSDKNTKWRIIGTLSATLSTFRKVLGK